MALSDDKLWHLWNAQGTDNMSKTEAFVFASDIASEVRKQDEALILMLVERLERADKISGYPNNKAAIKAGRARLEEP